MESHTTDFLIVGSGAAGMSAALKANSLGMDTLIIEKAPYYGGSTAMSGGGIWVPNNFVLKENGISDTTENVVAYLRAITRGEVPVEKLLAYAEKGPQMFDFLRKESPGLRFIWSKGYSDYHPEAAGGRKEGRSVEAEPFDLNELGADREFLQPADIDIPAGMWLKAKEFNEMSMVMRSLQGKETALKIAARTALAKLRGKRIAALGQSLAGRLRLALKQKNIPIWLSTPMDELIMEQGSAVGALVTKSSARMKIFAKKGILLASGGFEHNLPMRSSYLPKIAQKDYSAGSRNNTGDGILAGEKAGASLQLMDDAWWMPSVKMPNGKMFTLVSERAIPRSIIVGKDGKRFTNEASPYVNFVHAQIAAQQDPVFQILDQAAVNRYMYAGKPPMLPFSKEWYALDLVWKADTLEELAEKTGIHKTHFLDEIAAFNVYAKAGKDEKFHRGESAYDRYYGDPTLKNPVLDVIDTAPYYAVKVVIGDLGTKGGLQTDAQARVLDKNMRPIPGLYAAGNASASVMGRDYAGAGATIGPAMVFGYIAAESCAAG